MEVEENSSTRINIRKSMDAMDDIQTGILNDNSPKADKKLASIDIDDTDENKEDVPKKLVEKKGFQSTDFMMRSTL